MPKHSRNLNITLEMVEQSRKDCNLATGQAHCIDKVIYDNNRLPFDPIKMCRLWLCSPCLPTVAALGDPFVIQNLLISLGSSNDHVLATGLVELHVVCIGVMALDDDVIGDVTARRVIYDEGV
ncbi:hypothetical protein GUJ93_ZPchr0010g10255 [Zizania palustris]|uniref:Uncharacterized protein n=1 Tax=Zizania palustris TaxID=103762 RepID=A0A8J5WI21_ZIZPA|nr:hypothetical protein GUJ93_ZPchr0010g10255 [Zizania palustris]